MGKQTKLKNEIVQKTRTKTLAFLVLFLSLFFSHAEPLNALDVDYYDEWDSVGYGSNDDAIAWINTGLYLGVKNSVYDVYAFCTNNDRDSNSVYDICFVKNDTFYDESVLSSVSFPVSPWILSETSSLWASGDNLFSYADTFFDSDDFFGETSPIISTIFKAKRGQIQYYGIANPSINTNDINFGDYGGGYSNVYGTNTVISQKFIPNYDILRSIDIYIRSLPDGYINLSIHNSETGSSLTSKKLLYSQLSTGWINFDFNDIIVTSGNSYYMQLRTNSTAGNGLDNNYGSSCGDNVRWSIDSGSSFSDLYTLCHSLKTYGDDGLRSLGSTGNDDSQNYFFVDKMLLTCNIDGGDAISLSGEFASDTWLDINSGLSCDTLYGTGYVCDSQHDETMSTNPNSLPSLPCKLNTGVTCVDSADCWHNSACDGARISYSGLCNGTNVIIKDYNYVDSCGGSGVIDSTSYESQTSCTVDGGFPGGWGCDVNGPIIERTNKVDVYNDICKAGLGVSCAFDNDCVTGTTCESGLCSYYSLSIYSKNVSENKVYKNSVINFDGSVSVGLDIKYACWVFDSVNDECYGNISQCNIYCNGADYIGSNWETHYVKSFNNGDSSVSVGLITGDSNLYTSSYYESFCVSGDNVSCWSCFDNIMNDDETYPDWGGHCGSSIGVKCNNNRLDNVTFETSIDYGGSCGNCSGNVLNDTSYFILKDSGLITYPFNQSLCQESEEIVGGVVSFVLVLAGILIVPVLLLLVFLVVLFIFALFGLFGVTFGGLFGKFRNKGKKDGKNDDYS